MHHTGPVGSRRAVKCGLILLATIALTGCNSEREEELARKLADAEMVAAEANAEKLAAQRDAQAVRARVNEESYAPFYDQADTGSTTEFASDDDDSSSDVEDSAPDPEV